MKIEVPERVIFSNKQGCDLMAEFLRKAGLEVLPCDNSLSATKGYLSFFGEGKKERTIVFSWQFDKPIKKIEYPIYPIAARSRSYRKSPERKLVQCLTEKGWTQADEPQRLLVGYVNYKKSICRYFHLTLIRAMPADIQKLFGDWRKKNCSIPSEKT